MANLLPLETFRRIFGFHPYHFWGLADTEIVPEVSACNDVVYQYAWQNTQAAGRDEIIQAIENAEARLAEHLGFWPAPTWIRETLKFPQYYAPTLWRMSQAGPDGWWLDMRLQYGHVQALGVEGSTPIGTPAVALTDEDGDGLADTFTTTIATTVTNSDEIALYFSAADRLYGEAVSERYRIKPISVTISG